MFYIDNIDIKGFRNYRMQKIQFHPSLNILSGDNAQGKTNLLEAIYYLAVNRSFRTNSDHELLNWDDCFFLIKGCFKKDSLNYFVRLSYDQNRQIKIRVNDNPVKRFEHLQLLPLVVFSPDDLQIISDGPSVRRRFLNLLLSRLEPQYLINLRDYQRVLLQRNRLLKEKHRDRHINKLLEPWDLSLVNIGSKIIHYRTALRENLETEAQLFFQQLTGQCERLSLLYNSTVNYSDNSVETITNFHTSLMDIRNRELIKRVTLLGPHLDDLKILINNYEARFFSSQGQKRTAALALKVAEVNLLQIRNNEYPIIILDDVFSEFDSSRKENLLTFLRESTGQCFLSTAQKADVILEDLKRDYSSLKVYQGRIEIEKN